MHVSLTDSSSLFSFLPNLLFPRALWKTDVFTTAGDEAFRRLRQQQDRVAQGPNWNTNAIAPAEESNGVSKDKDKNEANSATAAASVAAPKPAHHATRHSDEDVRRRHCKGEVLVLGANGISIEALPSNARKPMFNSEEERKRLGRKVASMEVGTSFGQVGLLNRTPRSATCISEGATMLVCDKAVCTYGQRVSGLVYFLR